MPVVKFYKPDVSLQWVVKQFETVSYDSSNQLLTDKFIPRPDAALVFHFKNIPKVIAPVISTTQIILYCTGYYNPKSIAAERQFGWFYCCL